MQGLMSRAFKRLSRVLVEHPWKGLFSFLVFAPLMLGLFHVSVETRPDRLWASTQISGYMVHKEVYMDYFGAFPASVGVIFVAPEDADVLGGRLTCGSFLSEIRELEQQILALENYTYERLCLRPLGPNAPCMYFSPLQYWNDEDGGCNADANKHITVSQNFHQTPLGVALSAGTVFGGLKYQGRALVGANAASLTLFLADSESDEAIAWMRALVKLVASWRTRLGRVRVPFAPGAFDVVAATTPISLADASTISIEAQWWLPPLAVSMTLLVMFCALGLSFGLKGLFLGGVGFFLVCYAVACSLGATSLVMPTNPVTLQVAAILVLAVSVDITFVLGGLSCADDGSGFREVLIQRALSSAGPSLFFAMLMLILTFACSGVAGTVAGLNVVLTVVIASVITFVTQCVCLSSLMLILARRNNIKKKTLSLSRHWSFSKGYAKLVKTIVGSRLLSWMTVLFFVAVGGACISFAVQVQPGIDSKILAPRGSNDEKFQTYVERCFGMRLGAPWYWMVSSDHFNSSLVQEAVHSFKNELMGALNVSSIASPISNLVSWIVFLGRHKTEYQQAGNRIPTDKFVPWLQEFLASEGKLHRNDCVFRNNTLVAFRALSLFDADSIMELAQKFRFVLEDVKAGPQPVRGVNASFEAAAWSPLVPVLSQFFHLGRNVTVVILLSVLLVSLSTTLFFWRQFSLPIVLFVCIALVLVDMLAFMALVGVNLNGVTSLTIVTGIGLTAEYLLQLLQLFAETKDIIAAAEQVGASLILSVLSSCVGMLIIVVFSDSTLVRLYLSALWLCVFVLGAFHAFFLAPVLLSLFTVIPCQRLKKEGALDVEENLELEVTDSEETRDSENGKNNTAFDLE